MHVKREMVMIAVAGLLIGVAGAMSAWLLWKPVMPDIVVALKVRQAKAPYLLLIYDQQGRDPFVIHHSLLPGQRIGGCATAGQLCVMPHARYEFRKEAPRRQSIQILRMQEGGNQLVGGATWAGSSYPRRLEINCDLTVTDPRRACAIKRVTN